MGIILFDGECPLCVSLAHWSSLRMEGSHQFMSFQDYCRQLGEHTPTSFCSENFQRPDSLFVIDNNQVFRAQEAWAWILQRHPSLKELSWVATKLGLESRLSGQLEKGGHWIRRLCRKCSPKVFYP